MSFTFADRNYHLNRRGLVRSIAKAVVFACLATPLYAQQQASERQIQSFYLAIKANDFSFVGNMTRLGLGPDARDSLGNNPLMIAIREEGIQMVMLMLEDPLWQTRAVLDHKNQLGETALMLAALNRQNQVAGRLIALGAEVNAEGWTALHYAATSGHVGTISLLLEHHAYVDAESPNKTTPLMMAARFNHTEAAKLLLSAGADPTNTNESGFRARDYARESNNKDLEFFLELEEIAFENRYLNRVFKVTPEATLEEIVIQSGGSVVVEGGAKPATKEATTGKGTEVFDGIR